MTADAAGGVWTYALDLIRSLADFGIDTTLCTLGPPPSTSQQRDAASVPKLDLQCTSLSLDWTAHGPQELDDAADDLKQRATECGAGLIHLNAPGHAGIRPWSKPLVVAAHSCVATWWRAMSRDRLPADLGWRRRRTAAGLELADAIIVPSRSFATTLVTEYGDLPTLSVVPNSRWSAPVSSAVRTHILTAGRLWDPAKNIRMIDAVAGRTGMTVLAAGSQHGPNGERITLRYLRHLGTLPAMALCNIYAQTRIFVSVPHYEPFGLAVLEAAQAGCALILSDIPTLRELWNGAAVFVDPSRYDDLATSLERLHSDERGPQNLGELARLRASSFTPRRTAAGVLDTYDTAYRSFHRLPSATTVN
jgi:glycosyltransferase involved in cell wall biosynthesis